MATAGDGLGMHLGSKSHQTAISEAPHVQVTTSSRNDEINVSCNVDDGKPNRRKSPFETCADGDLCLFPPVAIDFEQLPFERFYDQKTIGTNNQQLLTCWMKSVVDDLAIVYLQCYHVFNAQNQ